MEETSEILKNNRTEDLSWFCSLSESELDLLISLKKLAIQRAKICCHQELAEKFDLKMLRALGLLLMNYVSKRVQDDTALATSVVRQLRFLDNCNLLKTHIDDTIDIEKILTETCNKKSSKKRKRLVGNLNTQSKARLIFIYLIIVSSVLKLYAFFFVFSKKAVISCSIGVI